MKTLACSVCLVLVGVAPVAADNDAPKSLRMRPKKAPGSHWSPMRWAKRIAQAAPTPDQPPAGGDAAQPAPPTGEPAHPAAEPSPQPAAPATAAEQQAPALSDEELAKLAEQEAKTEVITVTGSLIGRKEVDSPSPVSVVDKEKLQAAGITNVGDVLQKIPAQGNAINAQNNNGGDGSTRINLRSLGTARTLVLLNGRRVVPSGTGADASVDFGTIPLAMIERVEVLKDGASAIYGSDAIAGVVNVITRTNMNGTEASIYTATSNHRDGTNYDLSFVTGHSSTRGNITFSAGYQQQKSVMAGERGFASQFYSYEWECAPAAAAAGECAQRVLNGSVSSPTGRINSNLGNLMVPGCTSQYCTADGHGGWRNFIEATETSYGDRYNFQPKNYLFTPSNRVNLFSNGHYDITKNTKVFFEGQFNARRSTQQLAEEPVSLPAAGVISKDSIYNPFGSDVLGYNRRLIEFGPRTFNQEINTSRLVVGLNGTINDSVPVVKNWKWEGSFNYGRSDATQASHGSLIRSHLQNALGPSFRDGLGAHCGTPGAEIAGCVPLSLLRPGEVTKDMIDYVTFTGTQSGFSEQHTALLTVSGKVVDLPNHGDISVAVGGDYRFEKGGQQPDPLTATGDTTGNGVSPTLGSYNVYEGFAELSVVPYSGGDFLKWVEVNAAARAYRYNTFGNGATGKVSGLIRTAMGVALRGTYGTAFRAPNVGELYSGLSDAFPGITDPCDTKPGNIMVTLDPKVQAQCTNQGVPVGSVFGTAQQRAQVGGNSNLKAERGNVGTVGIVYEPLRGLDFTLDYWHVQIDDAIDSVPIATIFSQCYFGGRQEFCNRVKRSPIDNSIDTVEAALENVGSRITSGLDFSAAYQYRNSLGTFRHALEGTYLFKYNLDTGFADPTTGEEQVIHGRGFYDLGVNPSLKFNVFTTWLHPSGLGAGFNVAFVNSYKECDNDDCNNPDNVRREVSKYARGDVFLSYALKSSQGTTSITGGVNNVTDAQPPFVYNNTALNTDESAYDFMGRQFYVRLSQQF